MGLELRHKIYIIIFYAIELIFFPIYMWNFVVDIGEKFCFSRFIVAILIVHSLMKMISENPISKLEVIWTKIADKSVKILGDVAILVILIIFFILKITLIEVLF